MRPTSKSGGRQPAVVPENALATAADFSEPSTFAPARSVSIPRLAYASRSWLRVRMLLLMCVSYPKVRYPHHGWLTPAAPGCATCVPCGMRHLRCTNARAHKSGGRQPAVVGKPNALRRKSPTIRRRCDARTRAAGVSPPWSVNWTQCGENRPPFDHDATHEQERRASARRGTGNRVCNGDRLFRTQRVRPARSVTVPRLAYTSRSWLHDIQRFDCRAYPTGHKTTRTVFPP
jgi:hypothetical protein